MEIIFSKEKWKEVQDCWIRIKDIITSKESKTTSSNNELERDIALMDGFMLHKNKNNTMDTKKDISNITSNEFNNIMNEIDYDVKLNQNTKHNQINNNNNEYNKLTEIQKNFITKPVILYLFIYLLTFKTTKITKKYGVILFYSSYLMSYNDTTIFLGRNFPFYFIIIFIWILPKHVS